MIKTIEQFKQQMMQYRRNMCVTCAHNGTCKSLLHGHVTPETGCPEAESISEIELMKWAMRDIYNFSPEEERLFIRSLVCKAKSAK